MKKIIHSTLISAVLTLATVASATPITSAADAALSNSILVNFNSLPSGNAISYDMGAVTFKSLTSSTLSIASFKNQYGTSGQSLNNDHFQAFEAVFDTTASAFGIVGGAYNSAWTFTAYDVNNSIIETLNVNNPCCGGHFDGIAAAGIKRVTFSPVSDWAAFDDFRFTTTTTQTEGEAPEPGSLALLGLGLMGFVAARNKKN